MRALLCVALLLGLAGFAAASTSGSPVFRRADGSAIVFPPGVRAWCDRTGLIVVSLGRTRQSHWELDVARRNLRPGRIIRFSWLHERGVVIFVYDATTRNEASQGGEGSRGTVTPRRATCKRGGALAIGLSGKIASEFSDGTPVRVSGTYRGRVGPPPGR
ncbi:MAG: hypothetical protein ACJ75L_05425 [Gaiellaceae bacterium]